MHCILRPRSTLMLFCWYVFVNKNYWCIFASHPHWYNRALFSNASTLDNIFKIMYHTLSSTEAFFIFRTGWKMGKVKSKYAEPGERKMRVSRGHWENKILQRLPRFCPSHRPPHSPYFFIFRFFSRFPSTEGTSVGERDVSHIFDEYDKHFLLYQCGQ